jgi:heme-degrading monooxygenase HmoA
LVDDRQLRQHAPQGESTMIVTVFRSRLMPNVREEYVALVDRMIELAETMPGYISHKGFFADDGERVTVVEFEHEEGMRAWRMHPEHRAAQKKAREIYYSEYSVQVCNLVRESRFKREELAAS